MERVRNRVRSSGDTYWRVADFQGLSSTAVAQALSRLCRTGEIKRTGKGLYYRPKQTAFGPTVPSMAFATSYLVPTLQPTGISAANTLGLSTQNTPLGEFATTRTDRPTHLVASRVVVGRPSSRSRLTSREAALLEILRDGASKSDLSPRQTWRKLRDIAKSDIRLSVVARVALDEPPRVRAMLGALADAAGYKGRPVQALRKSLNPLSRFDFGRLAEIPNASEWHAG